MRSNGNVYHALTQLFKNYGPLGGKSNRDRPLGRGKRLRGQEFGKKEGFQDIAEFPPRVFEGSCPSLEHFKKDPVGSSAPQEGGGRKNSLPQIVERASMY